MSEEPVFGITTWAEKERGVWLRESAGGQVAQIGVYDAEASGMENRMKPVFQGFSTLGLETLQRACDDKNGWFYIDEIGYLESGCAVYCRGILDLMEQKRLLAVVRRQELPFLRELQSRPDVYVYDLDAPVENLGCVIMASGLGRRFGSNKLIADFNGRPMLAWALDATEGVFARRVVVTRHDTVEAYCQERGIAVIRHELPYRSDTVRLGLDFIGDEISGCMFCPGDQPLLLRETVHTMALTAARLPEYIWQLTDGERPGTPVVFPKWAFEELRSLPDGKGGNVLAKKYPEQVRFVPTRDSYELLDVDQPDDLNTLTSYLEQ